MRINITKKMKKNKDFKKREEKKSKSERKEKNRDKERDRDKEKHRDKDKERERKRKKEEEERKKIEHARKKQRKDDSSNSENSDDSSDDEDQKFSIFDEPVFDENNPIYFSMYDKVKARRSCVKAREEEEARKQQEALDKFSKLKAQRLKREGKKAHDSSDDMSDLGTNAFSSGNESDLMKKKKLSASMLMSTSALVHKKSKPKIYTDSESNTDTKPVYVKKEQEEKKKLWSESESEPVDNKSSVLAVLTKAKKKSPMKELD